MQNQPATTANNSSENQIPSFSSSNSIPSQQQQQENGTTTSNHITQNGNGSGNFRTAPKKIKNGFQQQQQQEIENQNHRASFHQPPTHQTTSSDSINAQAAAIPLSTSSQQQHLHQPKDKKIENIHAHNGRYDESLECLQEIFGETQLCDLDVLGRELGLAPDVVIKACEIALRERDLTTRKAKLFEDLF